MIMRIHCLNKFFFIMWDIWATVESQARWAFHNDDDDDDEVIIIVTAMITYNIVRKVLLL